MAEHSSHSLDSFSYSHARRSSPRGEVRPGEFTAETVLIAGGDVGSGPVAARLVARGGGLPVIARCARDDEALRLQAELRAGGADCVVLESDPTCPGELFEELENNGLYPTQLYHFMRTGPFDEPSTGDSRTLYEHFARVHVDAFVALALGCRVRTEDRLGLFYASSTVVAVEESPLHEYTGALAAGEELCWDFAGADPSICSIVCRLPHVLEDPSSSLAGGSARPAGEVLTAPLRALQRARAGLTLSDCIDPAPGGGHPIPLAS